jgi:hypothetical protein
MILMQLKLKCNVEITSPNSTHSFQTTTFVNFQHLRGIFLGKLYIDTFPSL